MANSPTPDRWLEVLAGRAEPNDADTRKALQAREYYERSAAADMAHPVDEERTKRLLNLMGAQAAERRLAQRKAATVPPGLFTRLQQWLFPAEGGGGLRLAGTAAALMGVAVVVGLVMRQAGDDDPSTMKSPVPPGTGMSTGTAAPGGAVQTLVVPDAAPLQRAMTLKTTLAARGVNAEVVALATGARLEATVPAAQQAAVKADLAAAGIN